MLLSCEPLHSWDRERSNTHAKSPRFVRKGFRHPFFLHSAASAITSPPHKAYSLGVFLIKGPRFWSRARSRLLAKATHVSGGKICPEFAPQSRRLLRCRFDVRPDPRKILHLRPQAGNRARVEHRLTAGPIPPERAAPVLVLEGPYRLQDLCVRMRKRTNSLQILRGAVGAGVDPMLALLHPCAVAEGFPLAAVALAVLLLALDFSAQDTRLFNPGAPVRGKIKGLTVKYQDPGVEEHDQPTVSPLFRGLAPHKVSRACYTNRFGHLREGHPALNMLHVVHGSTASGSQPLHPVAGRQRRSLPYPPRAAHDAA